MHREDWDWIEVFEMGGGVDRFNFGAVVVDAPDATLGWVGWEVEFEEVTCCAFEGDAEKWVGIATASCGDHTACGHASHCGFGHVEDSELGDGFEDAINFGDALGEGVDGLVWGVCALGVAFAVSWEVDGDRSDSGACPAVVSSGVEFFVDCSAMDPEDPGAGGLGRLVELRMDDERGDISSEPSVFGLGLEGFGECFEAVVYGWVLGHSLMLDPASIASGRSLPSRSSGQSAVRGESSMVALTVPSEFIGTDTPLAINQFAAR